jgi:hypothetical protein
MSEKTKITREKLVEEIARLEYNLIESQNYNDKETVRVYQQIIVTLKNTLKDIEKDLVF